MSPEFNIELDGDVFIIGIKNKIGKYEFFENSDTISAYDAYANCRYISSRVYNKLYCLPDEDEFDMPFYLYENKIFPDEYDDFRIINIDEMGSYFYGMALKKSGIWSAYTIYSLVNSDIEIEELPDLKGKNIELIETTFRNWTDDVVEDVNL